MDNNKTKKSSFISRIISYIMNNSTGAIMITAAGVVILLLIFLIAKGLFTSNSKQLPAGVNTATINTDSTEAEPKHTAAPAVNDISDSSSSAAASESSAAADDTSSSNGEGEKLYVTQYAYLHTKPANDAENIVCMSPGVEVTVLGYEDNGYVKITFVNIDGPLTGYIYKDYLASYSNNNAATTQASDNQNTWQGTSTETEATQNQWQTTTQNQWQNNGQ